MKISRIASEIDGKILCSTGRAEDEVTSACAFDMMSDVLAYAKDHAVLLTGLVNPQVIRTAEMMDVICVVFVRGKEPTGAMISLAQQKGLVLLSTELRLFHACGILYANGLEG